MTPANHIAAVARLSELIKAQEDCPGLPRYELAEDARRMVLAYRTVLTGAEPSGFTVTTEAELLWLLAVRELRVLEAQQPDHPFYPKITLRPVGFGELEYSLSIAPDYWRAASHDQAAQLLRDRTEAIALSESDNYQGGVWFDSWDVTLWEMLRLRVRNPGLPVHFLLSGANGSAKTYCAAVIMVYAMMHTQKKLFWCLTRDEPSSETVQQKAIYFWLPNEYKTSGGGIKGTARGKLKFNDSGGFTDNRFSLYHGASMEFRFWSADVATLEGPRPYAVWSDEEIPLLWIEGVNRRLLTAAEGTKNLMPQWERLLREKQDNPALKFPRAKLGDLMMGFHLITYTPAQGYTETVRTFMENARVMETIEADAELLPRRNKNTGTVEGGEILPRLVYSADKAKAARMLYAWENPIGGNWPAMKQIALTKRSRGYTLWWCYGVAEKMGDSPFSNFNIQVHVRPRLWLPKHGTWYHVVDPTASGGKCWTMNWWKVAAEQQGDIWPGDWVLCHEYPQGDDFIPGIGYPDAWAQPGGDKGRGIKGSIQHAWPVGYEWRANEIKRIECKLGRWEAEARGDKWDDATTIKIPDGNRIMDSRAANTETQNETAAKTVVEHMEDFGIYFIPAGRDSGAAKGDTKVHPGEQMINSALMWDRDLAEIDPATGWMSIPPAKGRGPRMWIMDHCTNTIAALQNYPGIHNDGDKTAWKDLIDPIRYFVIADPSHTNQAELGWHGGGGSALRY